VAENERVAATLGWSPARISTVNWAIGGGLAGLGGAISSSVVSHGFSYSSLSLAVVPALSAALLGAFTSFPLAISGGLLIGALQALVVHYLPTIGLPDAVPFLVILFVLLFRGKAVPLRSHQNDRLPFLASGKLNLWAIAGAAVAVAVCTSVFTPSWTASLSTTLTTGVVALSLVIVLGYAGQLSLAQFAIVGIAALIASRLSNAGVPLPLVLLLTILLTVPVGMILALFSVRVRGSSLAILTLGFALVVNSTVFSNPTLTEGRPIFGVPQPLDMGPTSAFGYNFGAIYHPTRYVWWCLVMFLLVTFVVSNVRRSRTGRRLIAVRDNERVAMSLGISVARTKVYAFSLASAVASIAGVLVAYSNTSVDYSQFDVLASVNVVLVSVIGGVGSIFGAAIAGISATGGVIEKSLSDVVSLQGWYPFVAALVLLLTVVLSPDGVAIAYQMAYHRIRSRRAIVAVQKPAPVSAKPAPVSAIERVEPHTLSVESICVRFGGVAAVRNVSFCLEHGKVLGLIGANGAGKTTIIDTVSGFQRPASGTVLMDGVAIGTLTPTQRARLGIARSFQSVELLEDLTVEENLRVGSERPNRLAYLIDLVRPRRLPLSKAAQSAIVEFGLAELLDERPTELSYAQRRLVSIARTVARAPSVLLLDEPAAGLDSVSYMRLRHLVRRLADEWGMAVLLVDHDVEFVMATSDSVLAIEAGEQIACGLPAAVRSDPAVIASYLGASV
jgi:ABC-type branched-subunit amino acid transport system ATPase component/ABC-type branched-subunit amino acid transport system permease subunit